MKNDFKEEYMNLENNYNYHPENSSNHFDKIPNKYSSNNYSNISFDQTANTNQIIQIYNSNEHFVNCLEKVENLIEKIGFNGYFIINFIASGLTFLAEGAQIYSISVLNPIFHKIYKGHNDTILSLISSIFYIGFIFGSLSSAIISKKYNRKIPIISSNFASLILIILFISWENIYWNLILKFFIGFCLGIMVPLIYNNFSESIPSTNREIYICTLHAYYRLGVLFVIFLINFLIPTSKNENWRLFYSFMTIPHVFILILVIFFIEESPKLYYHKKQISLVIKSISKMGSFKWSNHIISDGDIKILIQTFDNENSLILNETIAEEKLLIENFSDIHKDERKMNLILHEADKNFSYSNLFNRENIFLTLSTCALMLAIGTLNESNMYFLPLAYSLISKEKETKINSISNDQNDRNYALILFISNVVALLGIFIGIILVKSINRKNTVLIGLFCCFIPALINCFLKEYIVIFNSFINFFVVIPYVVVKLFIAEAFPTNLRDYGFAFSYIFKRLGDFISPFFVDGLIKISILSPYHFIASICFLGFLAGISLQRKYDGMRVL